MYSKKTSASRRKIPMYTVISILVIMFTFAQYIAYPFFSISHVHADSDDISISSDYMLEEDTEVDSLTVEDGTLDLNGYTLTVKGSLSQTGGTIDLNQGTVKVGGNVNQSGGTLNTNKGKLLIDGSYSLTDSYDDEYGDYYYSSLNMSTSKDYILVGKDFTVGNYGDDYNSLEAGVLEVKGNFTQKNYDDNFVPNGTHKVILSGASKQIISFESPSSSLFNILELTKPLPIGYTLKTSVNWNQLVEKVSNTQQLTGGSLILTSDWKLPYDIELSSLTLDGGILDLNGHTLTITGGLNQTGGTVDLNQGTVKVGGNVNQSSGTLNTNKGKLLIDGSYSLTDSYDDEYGDYYYSSLNMSTSKDYILVGKDFTVGNYGDDYNSLEAGILEVKGNFTQKNYDDNFVPNGTHKVILSGAAKQTVSFESPYDSRFNILEVTKPLLTGYKFATKVNWVQLIQTKQTIPVTSVALDQATLALTVGDAAVALKATIQPSNATNKKVTWSSSNPAVAAVDANGAVTPKAAGIATITVKTEDGNKTATATVTVKNKVVSPTAVELDTSTLSFTVGDAPITLQSTVLPENATNKNVTWISSNPSVATVDENGEVTPVSAGTAVITVTTEDGNKTATATVTVRNKVVSPTGVKLNTSSLSFTVGDAPTTLQSTVLPDNATNKNVTWTSSNPSVATVDGKGAVTPVGAGTAVITVTTEDGKKTATCTVTVSAKQNPPGDSSYTLDDFVNDSDLFNDVLGKYTLDQIQITLPVTYIQRIKVTRNDALKVSTFEIHADEDTVDRVNIVTAGKTYALTAKGDGVFTRSISGLVKGSEFIVKAYDENGKVVEDSVQRVIPMDYTANVPTQDNLTLQMLVDDIDLFNSLLDGYTLDQMYVVLPKVYIQDIQTTYSTLATKIVVNTDTAITKVDVEIKGKIYALTNKGNGKFERAIAGLARGTTFKVKVYAANGSVAEEKVSRVK